LHQLETFYRNVQIISLILASIR